MSPAPNYDELLHEVERLGADRDRLVDECDELADDLTAARRRLRDDAAGMPRRTEALPVQDAAAKGRGAKAQKRAERSRARERFNHAKKVTKTYERQLRSVARQVGTIVKGMAPKGIVPPYRLSQLTQALAKYAEMIRPWAHSVTETMLREVAQRDEIAWASAGREIGREMRKEIKHAPTGKLMQQLMGERVDLITSLPTKAAQRVHKLTIEAMSETGARAAEIAKEIQRTGHVTESRAMLIARTEVSSTASVMTEARARFVGSEGYFWRTVGDSDVRHDHRKLEGKFIRWDEPPIAGEGKGGTPVRYHAGRGPNCRCYAEPALPDVIV